MISGHVESILSSAYCLKCAQVIYISISGQNIVVVQICMVLLTNLFLTPLTIFFLQIWLEQICSSNLHKHFWTEHCCCPDLHGSAYKPISHTSHYFLPTNLVRANTIACS
jgi:hypothetical protein